MGAQKSNQQRDRTEGKSGRPSSSALIMMKPGENRLQTKQTAFFSTRVGHIQIFSEGTGRPIFSHDKSAVERNGQSVEDDAEESGAERWADYARVGWPASTCIKLSRHAPFSSSFPFRRSRDDGRDYTSWKGAVLQTYRLSLKVRSQTS